MVVNFSHRIHNRFNWVALLLLERDSKIMESVSTSVSTPEETPEEKIRFDMSRSIYWHGTAKNFIESDFKMTLLDLMNQRIALSIQGDALGNEDIIVNVLFDLNRGKQKQVLHRYYLMPLVKKTLNEVLELTGQKPLSWQLTSLEISPDLWCWSVCFSKNYYEKLYKYIDLANVYK